MEDDIDLRKYVEVILRHWKLLVITTVSVVFVVGLVNLLLPSVYQARASALITGARSQLILEPGYRTSFDEDTSWLQSALVAVAKSHAVAAKVIEQMGDKLVPDERKAGTLLSMVEVKTRGYLLEIQVESDDPGKAADIANAWVSSYVDYANGLYRGYPLLPEELRAQEMLAKREYEAKQKAWEEYTASSRIDELSRRIADRELLYYARLINDHLAAGPSSQASGPASGLAFLQLQVAAFSVESQLGDAASQLQASASTGAAGTPAPPPVKFEVSVDQLSGLEVRPQDIDALMATLEARSGTAKGLTAIELRQEISQLRAEMEQEKAREREVLKARDIAWGGYETVAGKIAEAEIASQARSTVVQVAEVAGVPRSPVGPRRAVNVGIGLVLGIALGVIVALGAEYAGRWRRRPAAN